MTDVVELLERVTGAGITIAANGDRLHCTPRSKLSPNLIKEIRRSKPELLAVLHVRTALIDAQQLTASELLSCTSLSESYLRSTLYQMYKTGEIQAVSWCRYQLNRTVN